MTLINAGFLKAWDIERETTLFSSIDHLPQMCLNEEPGIVDLSEIHIEGELIDNIIVFWRGASIDIWLI